MTMTTTTGEAMMMTAESKVVAAPPPGSTGRRVLSTRFRILGFVLLLVLLACWSAPLSRGGC